MMSQQQLAAIFNQVDRDRSGTISSVELQSVLANGLQTNFNIKTVELMICMFDRDMNGTIDFNEFSQLFSYVQAWQNCFRQYDRDQSNGIDCNEFCNALVSFGYRLSPSFINMMMRKFDRTKRGTIAFDDFILACVCLQNLTCAFKQYDVNRNGTAQFSFEQFLCAAFSVVS